MVSIIADQRIKRASTHVAKGERKAVWFSCRDGWEPTATKGIIEPSTGERRNATVDEMVSAGGSLVRIQVPEDIARHTWEDYLRYTDPRVGDRLEAVAREMSSVPSDWRVSYHDVPTSQVLNLEASTDGSEWRYVGRPIDEGGFELDEEFVEDVRVARRRGQRVSVTTLGD